MSDVLPEMWLRNTGANALLPGLSAVYGGLPGPGGHPRPSAKTAGADCC